jgi:rhodanese-related sulfurtransferase
LGERFGALHPYSFSGHSFMSERGSTGPASSFASEYAGDLGPQETWDRLRNEPEAQLVDVRTVAEWNFVGIPDLSSIARQTLLCEWQRFPPAPNSAFVQEVADALKGTQHRSGAALYFLCRSGARSRAAAIAMTKAGFGPCFNIADGFEGGLDADRHRGHAGGWKAIGLPWIQT